MGPAPAGMPLELSPLRLRSSARKALGIGPHLPAVRPPRLPALPTSQAALQADLPSVLLETTEPGRRLVTDQGIRPGIAARRQLESIRRNRDLIDPDSEESQIRFWWEILLGSARELQGLLEPAGADRSLDHDDWGAPINFESELEMLDELLGLLRRRRAHINRRIARKGIPAQAGVRS